MVKWTAAKIKEFVTRFEYGDLSQEEWDHKAHLIVCRYYLKHHDYFEALLKIKLGIIHFNDAVGTPNTIDRGYHETLTQFWVWAVHAYLKKEDSSDSGLNKFFESPHSNKFLPLFFYSEDVLFSNEARVRWVSPDVNPLDAQLIITSYPSSIWY